MMKNEYKKGNEERDRMHILPEERVRIDYKDLVRLGEEKQRRASRNAALRNLAMGAVLGAAAVLGVQEYAEHVAVELPAKVMNKINVSYVNGSSLNWSGYDAISFPGAFKGVSGSFIVPRVSGNGGKEMSVDIWIGVGGGGGKANGLIQAGVNVLGSGIAYAWMETLPERAMAVRGLEIQQGDKIDVKMENTSGSNWIIEIADQTNRQVFATEVSYNVATYSAECIVERGLGKDYKIVELPKFSNVNFSYCAPELTDLGMHGAFEQLNGKGVFVTVLKLDMRDSDKSFVTRVSGIKDNGGFSVQYLKRN